MIKSINQVIFSLLILLTKWSVRRWRALLSGSSFPSPPVSADSCLESFSLQLIPFSGASESAGKGKVYHLILGSFPEAVDTMAGSMEFNGSWGSISFWLHTNRIACFYTSVNYPWIIFIEKNLFFQAKSPISFALWWNTGILSLYKNVYILEVHSVHYV